jgi:hypothetical protein
MFQQDFLMRMVQQMMAVAMRAIGMRKRSPEEALELIEDAKAQLPFVPGTLEVMSVGTVLKMLDHPQAAIGLAQLYRAQALVQMQLGQHALAQRAGRRALQFFGEVQRTAAASVEDEDVFGELAIALSDQ